WRAGMRGARGNGRAELPPFQERVRALRLLPPFLRLVWETHRGYATAIVVLRIAQALAPVALFWVSKLIFDVLQQVLAGNLDIALAWPQVVGLVLLELAIAVAGEVLQRGSALLESLLGDLFANRLSVRLIEHAATLDLERFEDPEFYDHL